MNVVDRLLYLTLLCLASQNNGVVKKCDEKALIRLTNFPTFDPELEIDVDNFNPYVRGEDFLKRVNDNGMITIHDNGDVTVNAFQKRQGSNLTGYERVKKYREKHKKQAIKSYDNTNDNINDNGMITSDKNRIDKIREEKKENSEAIASHSLEDSSDTALQEEWVDENGNPIQTYKKSTKTPRNKVALSIIKWYCDLVEKKTGIRPISDKGDYVRALFSIEKIGETETRRKLEEWLDNDRPEENYLSIKKALSNLELNNYRLAHEIK